jgi:hypothetical protein
MQRSIKAIPKHQNALPGSSQVIDNLPQLVISGLAPGQVVVKFRPSRLQAVGHFSLQCFEKLRIGLRGLHPEVPFQDACEWAFGAQLVRERRQHNGLPEESRADE